MMLLPSLTSEGVRMVVEAPRVGRVLAGRYELVELLAEGGMATVFRATTSGGSPREVAVKIMLPSLARDRTFVRRFQREARLSARLIHPRVARVLDHGVDGGLLFLVMELLDGEDLFDLLKHEGTLTEVSARRVVIEVCEALAEAHGLGIVHRDLKLENVFVARDLHGDLGVKVLDFGVAKMRDPEERISSDSMPALTAAGALLGTPEYMSPEQCRGETPGPESDVYACGVLLYTLLTGRPPFTGKSPVEVIVKHLGDDPPRPSALRPEIDPALEALVLRALEKEPADRPRSAAAFADALRALGPAPALRPDAIGLTARRAPISISLSAPAVPANTNVTPISTKPAPVGPHAWIVASPERLVALLLLTLMLGVVLGCFTIPHR